MDPLGRIPSLSFGHITSHPQSWWFKTTIYLAFDSVARQFGLGSASPLGGSLGLSWDPSCACGQLWAGWRRLPLIGHDDATLSADSVWSQNQARLGWGLNKGLWPTLKSWPINQLGCPCWSSDLTTDPCPAHASWCHHCPEPWDTIAQDQGWDLEYGAIGITFQGSSVTLSRGDASGSSEFPITRGIQADAATP